MNRSAAASTPESSLVATRSSSSPRVTASPSRAIARIECLAGNAFDLGEPAVDGAGHHAIERLLALGAAGVALEEEPFQMAQFGSVQVGPHRGEALRRIPWAVRGAGPSGGARPPRRSPPADPLEIRSGAATFDGWCRRRRPPRAVSGRRCRRGELLDQRVE